MNTDLYNCESSSIEIIYHNNNNNGDGDSSKEKLLDNKAMVTPLPSVGGAQQPTIRINITEPDKNNATQVSRIRFRKRIRLPYTINTIVCVIVTSLIILLELGYIPATKSGFYCQDPSLSYKFTGDTITATTLLVGSLVVIPLAVLFGIECVRKGSPSSICVREVWFFYKEFLTGCALVLLITEIAKALIGEHRPHFFDVCKPDTAENCTFGEYVDTYECTLSTYSRYFMSDTSRSFPSGHSSLSIFVVVFCSFIVQSRLPTIQTGRAFKPFFISILITWGLVCSLTRISDKRHHWWDVGAGMLLGVIGAIYSIVVVHRQTQRSGIPRVAMSTTTLLDIKNKDAKSEII